MAERIDTRQAATGTHGLRALAATAARHGHFALVALVMGTVALMVLPVPPALLDVLIAFNIASSVLMLMLAIYIPGAMGMSTFPSLIVLTTVLRLSLNIASTKQILLTGHAGSIIETFGQLVMGGQVAVGLVVFAIIAVVQFIVISKGAERVAEVAARFTLDAMPGRQMSIEADLRAGLIDKAEGRRLRSLMEQESHMHGAMDGAMKFVKGDAIAAIVIALVNIVAGIYIGTTLMDMSIGEAMSRFTLLSIGDGMVSQIPSLLTSVAAGVLTTRAVGQEGRPRNLAAQIGRQVVEQPMALIAASAILFGFMLVPGFPKLPFAVLAAGAGAAGWVALRRGRHVPTFASAGNVAVPALVDAMPPGTGAAATHDDDIVVPLVLRIAEDLRSSLSPVALQSALELRRQQVQLDLGVGFPWLRVRFDDALPVGCYAIDVQEIPGTPQQAAAPSGEGAPDVADTLADAVARTVRLRPDAFVGMQELNVLVKRVQAHLPDLSDEVTRAMPLQRVTDVMRRLALEGVSLRYLREVYESLLVWAPREKDPAMLCEHVRADLGRFICDGLLDDGRRLLSITVDAATEAAVRDGIRQGANGAYLALPPETVRQLTERVVTAVAMLPSDRPPVLLATADTRRYLRRLLATRLPQLQVLSYQEVPADVIVDSAQRVALPQPPVLRVASEATAA